MYRPNILKARLEAGESVYGAWVGSGSPGNAEMLGHVGFDFLVLDQEHGAGEMADAVDMLRAAESSGTPCVVRAPWNDPIWLKRILDAGAESVMIPSVETAARPRRGRRLPLPAAGPPRLRRRRGPRLHLRAGARLRPQGERATC